MLSGFVYLLHTYTTAATLAAWCRGENASVTDNEAIKNERANSSQNKSIREGACKTDLLGPT